MRTSLQSRSAAVANWPAQTPAPRLFAACALGVFILAALSQLAAQAAAQTTAPQPAPNPPAKTVRPHKRPAVVPAQATLPAPVAVTPPAPPQPHWPVNDHPAPPSVLWDSHGLRIDAANSSLEEILKEVSVVTGVKVEGLAADERVYGNFGPGQPRDVLGELLHGSSYNVIMVGDRGEGAPRQLLLSVRRPSDGQSAPKPAASPDEDSDVEDTSQQQPPPPPQAPIRPNFTPGSAPHTPQQIMQEMQQRQQELQLRQQQSLPNPPQN